MMLKIHNLHPNELLSGKSYHNVIEIYKYLLKFSKTRFSENI